ncbi:LysR family transcriptional regulator [Pseudooceanicola sp. CBS1P-1]|uniref:LysR family transcriptional regulator n=1 Tax=Pseudooceanicola albus TaxID=2692189 RepID=A0A6L7G876_9RHOB|nr:MULTISPECIES: LysR family transcriptional regulator [Pseudooceanicola]MBT9384113.1 LysR family transcriptional regulator [Pseudooceanicola endophyticus]MXN19787.1 LysR family transcriptional regulator [Pseudooceanicola albus]
MDRLTEMEAFATVVDQGGFTDAARKMGISKSAVSKHVSALEARLGVRLLNRTTRRVSPTEIGLAYYDRARRVLEDAGEADALVTAMHAAPSGHLRISVGTDFGVTHMGPVVADFLQLYPDVSVSLDLNNRPVDVLAEGFDMAVRIGIGPPPQGLTARTLAQTARMLVASPSYLQAAGRPQRIDDLSEHRLLHYADAAGGPSWQLTALSGEKRTIRAAGVLTVNDGRALLQAAQEGLGIGFLPAFLCQPALRERRLDEVLPELPRETLQVQALHAPGAITQPKLRLFVEHLARAFGGRGPLGW